MTLLGLPFGTATALAVVGALSLPAYALYRVDTDRASEHGTVFGRRPSAS
ncbi:hypothetical protein [Salinibacter altiplanensis]|nr:hypothetical protein [Salinibacter altiplanensis]